MKKFVVLALLTSGLFFTSCSSIPLASSTDDAEAKLFTPVKDKSVIYVYRNEFYGGAIGMDITFNGKELGGTTQKRFLRIVAQPGTHIVASQAENRDSVSLKSEAGKVYYIWQEAKMGVITARTKMNLVSELEGQRGVMECTLVDHYQPE